MHARHEHGGLVWLDLESPTKDEMRGIAAEFDIAPPIASELMTSGSKPRAESLGSYLYIVMHFPSLRSSGRDRRQEVDFLIGKNFLITAHYAAIAPLHSLFKAFEANAALTTEPLGDHAGYLFYYTMRKLYQGIDHQLDSVRSQLGEIEENIFSHQEVEMVAAISSAARALLNLRQTIEPHREILKSVEENGMQFFGEDFLPFLRSLSGEYYLVHNHIMRTTDALHELRETNNSLLTTKQNETLKTFTILAFVTLPLTLIAAVFTIRATDTPLVDAPHGFWIVVALMLLAFLAMLAFFKRKRWL